MVAETSSGQSARRARASEADQAVQGDGAMTRFTQEEGINLQVKESLAERFRQSDNRQDRLFERGHIRGCVPPLQPQ